MIPEFPIFKKLELSDKAEIEEITFKYAPYSDFNFTSLWAWDVKEKRKISILNKNLVVQFTDYATDEPFLSFLGNQKTEQTVHTLIDHSVATDLPAELRLMPEISIEDISSPQLSIVEDRANFDYIYSVSDLATLRGNRYMSKRGRVNKFTNEYPQGYFNVIPLAEQRVQNDIDDVIKAWENYKKDAKKEYELDHELEVLHRIFSATQVMNVFATGIFLQDKLLACSIDELLPGRFSINHFWKADSSYAGIFDFFMQTKAQYLEKQGVTFMNFEQDLGIPGLRATKSSFRPASFLKKYIVSRVVDNAVAV